MYSTDTAAQSPRIIVRAMRRTPVEVVEIVRHMRGIFEAERDTRRTGLLLQPVERTALAAGMSARTRRQPRAPHLSRISLLICESKCTDSLQSNVIRLTGCRGGMYDLIQFFPTSFKP